MEFLLLLLLPLLFSGGFDGGSDPADHGDTVDGTDGADTLHGSDGGDLLDAHAGNDDIFAGAGNDAVMGGGGQDYGFGQAGNDTLYGGDGADGVLGGSGDDSVYGGGGNDEVLGDGSQGDIGPGFFYYDQLEPAAGFQAGNDHLFGGDGNDFVWGGGGSDTLEGGGGADLLVSIDDSLSGAGGTDQVYGGLGRDTILADDGDTVTGGGWADSFEVVSVTTDDHPVTITDFNGAEDRLTLEFEETAFANIDPADLTSSLDQASGNVSIMLGGRVVALLQNPTGFDLSAVTLTTFAA